MAIVLGLLVSLAYGAGDFFGGLATKRSTTTSVVIGSFGLAAVLLVGGTLAWWVVGDLTPPIAADVWLGVGVGAVGPVALGLLYRGLATGRMSVVAPITAVVAASVPLAWGLATGERPSAVALAGVLVALVAVGLISGSSVADDALAPVTATGTVLPAALSGFGFGVVFILLGSTSADAGLWPLVAARPVAVALAIGAAALLARRVGRTLRDLVVPATGTWWLVAGAGVLDVSANVAYLAAVNIGLLSIVAVLSSLYPAVTVLLARVVLDERLHRLQVIGLLAAAAGVAAMALG